MIQLNQVYKCHVCGNMTEVVHVGGGQLVCCGKPMELLSDEAKLEGQEKHIPVIEKVEGGYKVKIGSIPHPMSPEHHIEWIELIVGEKICRQYLSPDQAPEAVFMIGELTVSARAYCNLHGLWKSN